MANDNTSASERMGVQSEDSDGQDERMHILRLPEELIAVVRPCHASTIVDPYPPLTLLATHAGLWDALLACVNALPHADAATRVQGLWPRVRHYERPHAATRQQALPGGRHAGGCTHGPTR